MREEKEAEPPHHQPQLTPTAHTLCSQSNIQHLIITVFGNADCGHCIKYFSCKMRTELHSSAPGSNCVNYRKHTISPS